MKSTNNIKYFELNINLKLIFNYRLVITPHNQHKRTYSKLYNIITNTPNPLHNQLGNNITNQYKN